jgi:hypothetical protein
MNDIECAFYVLRDEEEHLTALKWFLENQGKTISWSSIQEYSHNVVRLANQAKGIYKPRYTDYSLSVRQTLTSPYADQEVSRRGNGSWVYPYFQENSNPAERDSEPTNRGLMKCMQDRIPVGVLLQVKPKPGVEYDILGLAAVTRWNEGYFILEGYADDGTLTSRYPEPDAAQDRATVATAPLSGAFDPSGVVDDRERQIAEVFRRRGQARFRAALIIAYGGKCAVTGCDAVEALEAAHISPYRGAQSHHQENGLLLRADVHSLFDLGLLAIDPATMTVILTPQLTSSKYGELAGLLAGRPISVPADPSFRPSAQALAEHLKWTGIIAPPSDVTQPF